MLYVFRFYNSTDSTVSCSSLVVLFSLCINTVVVVVFLALFNMCLFFLCVHTVRTYECLLSPWDMFTWCLHRFYIVLVQRPTRYRKEKRQYCVSVCRLFALGFASKHFNYQLIHAHRFSNQFHLMYLPQIKYNACHLCVNLRWFSSFAERERREKNAVQLFRWMTDANQNIHRTNGQTQSTSKFDHHNTMLQNFSQ